MQLREVFACQWRRAKIALCDGGGQDVSWPRGSTREWPHLGQTKNNSTVESLNKEEESLSELRTAGTDQKKAVVRMKGVVRG